MEAVESSIWAVPRAVESLEDCEFYHTMEIPSYGPVVGQWDLRGDVDAYLGRQHLSGKRVLELGPASGFLTFQMEERGAAVVGFDLADGRDWNIVPHGGENLRQTVAAFAGSLERIKSGYWLAHAAHGSRARMVYGNIYRIPPEIGEFDLALFGSILLHLRDPFGALASAAPHVREKIVITEPEWFAATPLVAAMSHAVRHGPRAVRWAGRLARPLMSRLLDHLAATLQADLPLMYFLPTARAEEKNFHSWWHFSPRVLTEFLQVLGFPRTTTIQHTQLFLGRPTKMWTIVGERLRSR